MKWTPKYFINWFVLLTLEKLSQLFFRNSRRFTDSGFVKYFPSRIVFQFRGARRAYYYFSERSRVRDRCGEEAAQALSSSWQLNYSKSEWHTYTSTSARPHHEYLCVRVFYTEIFNVFNNTSVTSGGQDSELRAATKSRWFRAYGCVRTDACYIILPWIIDLFTDKTVSQILQDA